MAFAGNGIGALRTRALGPKHGNVGKRRQRDRLDGFGRTGLRLALRILKQALVSGIGWPARPRLALLIGRRLTLQAQPVDLPDDRIAREVEPLGDLAGRPAVNP